ncbi:MAG: endonuclease/exonuclease/phosphatase family protein [Pseudomonas sp.]|jgi:endonuclease/exonuclease/phosphatase (EEP) superfamily protein YafD|uniref:endonuclease/exonuclease/phosphatase family protein n=1 Tax=Halopseudomonas TaxID=2901189 RepID=UPI001B49E56A|nr:endonuclease/exonuclease/phosphatase family protein [Pseudomonas sp.]MBQ0777187.1 endonuclease/exonuclease/phosphatase family protein [Pseudomonas sp.]WOD10541.1 endonuclease/exonuclease/phosphatase family protein [Pseudomonas sp. NyZ704]
MIFSVVLFGLGLLLLAATILGKVPLHDWWLRACEFPRVQILSLALLCAALTLFSNETWQLATLGLCAVVILVQGWHIMPWTPLYPVQMQKAEQGDGDHCITLLISNVLTPNHQSESLISQILEHQPDVILTLESDDWWQEKLDAALDKDWPNSVKIPQDNLYGMHLYSRLPLHDVTVKRLIQDDIPSIHGRFELKNGKKIRFHAVHPRPPAPQESESTLWRDAELLLVSRQIAEHDGPTLLFGDLNDVAWSRTTRMFCRVSGMLDLRRGRGMYSTFNADHWFLRWPLDHIFTSEHFTLGSMKRLKHIGSDHFPIIATLCYRPARAEENDKPEREPGDKKYARETIQEAKANPEERDD